MTASRGTTIQGSRSAHDVTTPALHASDVEAAALTIHNPLPTVAGSVPMADGTKYVLTDVLTPTEHTAIGDGAPHHAPVTLGGGSDPALTLVGQQLALTLPAPPVAGQYRYLTYVIVAGVFEFICDVDGYPVYTLEDLE